MDSWNQGLSPQEASFVERQCRMMAAAGYPYRPELFAAEVRRNKPPTDFDAVGRRVQRLIAGLVPTVDFCP